MAFVQAKQNSAIGNTAITLDSAVSTGDSIIVFADSILAQGTITSVDDNKGNIYTMVGTFTLFAGIQQHIVQIWIAAFVNGGSSFTITSHSTGAFTLLTALEYTNSMAFGFDKSAAASTSGTTPSVGPTGTTTVINELLVCYIATVTGATVTLTAGSGYTKRVSVREAVFGANYGVEDQTVSSIGAFSAGWVLGTSSNVVLVLVTIKLEGPSADKIHSVDAMIRKLTEPVIQTVTMLRTVIRGIFVGRS